MIPPKIAPLPPAPVRADAPVDFSTKADAMIGALQPFANQANDLADFVNDRADDANASAASAADIQLAVSADRVLSQQAASKSAGSASAALNSAKNASDSVTAAQLMANASEASATAAQLSANASEASAVRAVDAAQYVEGITEGAAPIRNPNFQGVVKVNSVPLGTAAFRGVGTEANQLIPSDVFFSSLQNAGALASASATYEYDALGRVDKIVTPDGDTVIGYSPDGTVETISYPTGRVETYTYDESGNVISMTATGG